MVQFKPFRALRYDPQVAGDPSDLIAPPYDVIKQDLQRELHDANPCNVVNLILGYQYTEDTETDSRYTRAKATLQQWIADGILVRDGQPCFHLLRHEYTTSDGEKKTRSGLIGLLKLEDLQHGSVIPHERTLTAPRTDRINLIYTCRSQLEPVFCLFSDSTGEVLRIIEEHGAAPAQVNARMGDNDYSLTPIHGEAAGRINKVLEEKSVFIADGHHRYTAALTVHNRLKEQGLDTDGGPSGWVMIYLAAFEDPGILILPTHRGVLAADGLDPSTFESEFSKAFDLERVPAGKMRDRDYLRRFLQSPAEDEPIILLAKLRGQENGLLMRYRPSDGRDYFSGTIDPILMNIGVSVLHRVVLEGMLGINEEDIASGGSLRYSRDPMELLDDLENPEGGLAAAFLLKPMSIGQIDRASKARLIFPQKTTFFYPKVPSGLAFHTFFETEP